MKVLITGGQGFIGHSLICLFEKLGLSTYSVDMCIHNEKYKKLYDLRTNKFKNTQVYHSDINDLYLLDDIFNEVKPDFVVHCAGPNRQHEFVNHLNFSAKTMIEGLLNVLECSVKHKVNKLIYLSSSMVYGNFVDFVKEDDICEPIGHYGILKLNAERLVRDYTRVHNLKHVIVRPSAVYGPYDTNDRVIGKFFTQAFNNDPIVINGYNERLDFTYVSDLAEGIVKATLDCVKNKTYNLTKGESFSLQEAAKIIIENVGSGSITHVDKDINMPSRGALSIIKARQDFGYAPNVSLWQGLKQYYEWISNNPFWFTKTV